MNNSYKICFLIPCYNHAKQLNFILPDLIAFHIPILIIDDGSSEKDQELLDSMPLTNPLVTIIHHPINQGKGGAVITGLKKSLKMGFSHALQIDADGQHDLNDIEKMIIQSKKLPHTLISGKPIYDHSISKTRLYSRYITHIWVWIETLSFKIEDSMCGFRIYPLQTTVDLINTNKIGQYMDFDTEIMVKLFWRGIDIKFIPTKVIYPKNGHSNFRAVKDNILISCMHTKLFFGMLLRIPSLIYRKFHEK